MPLRSSSTGPIKGSAETNRTAAGTLRKGSRRQAACWFSTLTPIQTFSGQGSFCAIRASRNGRFVSSW